MKRFKKALAITLSVVSLASVLNLAGCARSAKVNNMDIFSNNSKISYSTDYYQVKQNKKNKTKTWRHGMVSGNGMQGFVESGSPTEDTFIFQNMHFIMPNQIVQSCPDTSAELETVKQNIVKGENIIDNASYDEVYYFHPGGSLRIETGEKSKKNYVRYTDYESSQVGVKYDNKNGTWERKSFTSMADDVVITKLGESSKGKALNLTLSYDDLASMANFGDGNERDMKYKKLVGKDASSLSLVAHYPNYEQSVLKDGGYATITYIVTDGTKEVVDIEKAMDGDISCGENKGVKITDAKNVYLISVTGRTEQMGKFDNFEGQESFVLVDELTAKAKAVADKYGADNFDYDTALANHLAIYEPQFNAVTLTLEDSEKSNDALLADQHHKKKINSALAQRTYYAGRYAYLCCSGYATSRLYGMWTGEFNAGWGSKYTMDANVNLQTSSMNTSNMATTPIGYAYFILRQVPGWEENAKNTHGFTDAIQAPVNSDGDNSAITETCYPYPFRYWNAGTSWILQPLFETLQTYGNIQIPLSEEFDLEKLKSVLSIDDKKIAEYNNQGYMMLEEDILLPLLTKSMNYWDQLMSADYYTAADGSIHYEEGKTELKDGETYCILPSYSPENNPSNYPSPSDANCAIDISACRDNIEMLKTVMTDIDPNADVSKWQAMEDKLPPYLYDETGALKEWATTSFEENNEHRHLSHLYLVWPLFETQKDEKLAKACIQAIANRESENEASHALVHRSLIAARLKDRDSLTDALVKLMNHRIRYDSLMTNHDYDQGSCYCTDFCIGYLGIINESLIFSNTGEIELLPALPTSGFDQGEITGVRTRTRATVDSLKWTADGKITASITSDIDQTIKVSYGDNSQDETFKAGETKTFEF